MGAVHTVPGNIRRGERLPSLTLIMVLWDLVNDAFDARGYLAEEVNAFFLQDKVNAEQVEAEKYHKEVSQRIGYAHNQKQDGQFLDRL